jgi:hypothetical protein
MMIERAFSIRVGVKWLIDLCKAILKARRALIAAAVAASHAPMPITSLDEPLITLLQLLSMSPHIWARVNAHLELSRWNDSETLNPKREKTISLSHKCRTFAAVSKVHSSAFGGCSRMSRRGCFGIN